MLKKDLFCKWSDEILNDHKIKSRTWERFC